MAAYRFAIGGWLIAFSLSFVLSPIALAQNEKAASIAEKIDMPESLLKDQHLKGVEGLRYVLVKKLMSHADYSLKGHKGCTGEFRTVGHFLAWSLAWYEKDRDNSIRPTCEKIDKTYQCTIMFYADSKGESPWACGLRFLLKKSGKELDLSSAECVGSC